MQHDDLMQATEREESERLLHRRLNREPLQYIVGETEFYGLTFCVSPDVLIPRPETEVVVDEAIRLLTKRGRVLDVGTGSGCIACAVKYERPNAHVVACDVSAAALDVARENARRLGLAVDFLEGDLLDDQLPAKVAPLDLLVSNPPYIPDEDRPDLEPEVIGFEPPQALFSGADPLTYYRRLVDLAHMSLTAGGALVVEVHIDYASDVASLASEAGLWDVRIVDDLTLRPRVVTALQPSDQG